MTRENSGSGVPSRLGHLSPAQKFVYDKLGQQRRASQAQLADQTQLTVRTIRTALERLCEEGEVREEPNRSGDARKKWYTRVRK